MEIDRTKRPKPETLDGAIEVFYIGREKAKLERQRRQFRKTAISLLIMAIGVGLVLGSLLVWLLV